MGHSARMNTALAPLLDAALAARAPLLDGRFDAAVRLFNGFTEGLPTLVVDLYGRTLVLHDYAASDRGDEPLVREAVEFIQKKLPAVTSAVWKVRSAAALERRHGVILLGTEKTLARRIREHGVWYAVNLTLSRDATFYVDTRPLRLWAKAHLGGKRVLNTFAYTGSLGVAARAVGALVQHTDLSRRFLTVAKDSYALNGFPVHKADFRTGDFFDVASQLKREDALFDCVFVDPPFFSVTDKGRVDLETSVNRLVNKVRPLVADGGHLALVNNALYLPGADFMRSVEALCADGYLSVAERLNVPDDTTGYPSTRQGTPVADPAPFNHSTKIVILNVRRKDGRRN
jgi:23S rRNA (cytosine1962-C5)-methyltransferase